MLTIVALTLIYNGAMAHDSACHSNSKLILSLKLKRL